MQIIVSVNPDCAGLETSGDLSNGIDVGRVNASRQSIQSLVGHFDGIVFGLETGDTANGTEYLFLHDLHVFVHIGEDRRLDEVTNITKTLATHFDFGTVLLASIDVAILRSTNASYQISDESLPHDTVKLKLRYLWTLEGVWQVWLTNNILLDAILEPFDKSIVDIFLYINS